MFHASMGRFQLESKLELPLISGFTEKKRRPPKRPAEDVRMTKGLQERTQLIE